MDYNIREYNGQHGQCYTKIKSHGVLRWCWLVGGNNPQYSLSCALVGCPCHALVRLHSWDNTMHAHGEFQRARHTCYLTREWKNSSDGV